MISVMDKVISTGLSVSHLREIGNHRKFPYIEEIVEICSLRTGKNVIYINRPVDYSDMDPMDCAEAYDRGYSPKSLEKEYGHMKADIRSGDLGDFWNLFEYYKKNPPLRAIRQIQALRHLEDIIMFYEESKWNELCDPEDGGSPSNKEYYLKIYIPKIKFLRGVKDRTMSNLKRGR